MPVLLAVFAVGAVVAAVAAASSSAGRPRQQAPVPVVEFPKKAAASPADQRPAPKQVQARDVIGAGAGLLSAGLGVAKFVGGLALAGGGAAATAEASALAAVALNPGALVVAAPVVIIIIANLIAAAVAAPKDFQRRLYGGGTHWFLGSERTWAGYLAQAKGFTYDETFVDDERTIEVVRYDASFGDSGGQLRVGGTRSQWSSPNAAQLRATALEARGLTLLWAGWRSKWANQARRYVFDRDRSTPPEVVDWVLPVNDPMVELARTLPLIDGSTATAAEIEGAYSAARMSGATARYIKTAALLEVVKTFSTDPRVFFDGNEYARRVCCALFAVPYQYGTAWLQLGEEGCHMYGTQLRIPLVPSADPKANQWNVGPIPDTTPLERRGWLAIDLVAQRTGEGSAVTWEA